MAGPALSLVVPVYNEAQVLEASLDAIRAYLEGSELAAGSPGFELICVDDGSADESRGILERIAAADPRVRVLVHPTNRGKGAAVRTGVLEARGEQVVFLDADLSTPLDELPRLLGALDDEHQVALGNRRVAGADIERHQPWYRETLGKCFTLLSRTLLAPGINDFTCGFKAFRGDAAREIFRRSSLDGWAFDAELIVIARARGYKMAQVPVRWRNEDDTKVRLLSAVVVSLRDVLVLFARRLSGRYR